LSRKSGGGECNCTEAQLRAAVKVVDVMADDVESYLRTQ
jgi:hypothetical protein